MSDDQTALARTAQLLRLDVFRSDPVDDEAIVAGLRATTARVVADRHNLASCAGQTALITLCGQLAMLGVQLDLAVADVALVVPQPPLVGDRLAPALDDYLSDLMPGGNVPSAIPDITLALGDTPAPEADVRLSGHGGRVWVGPAAAAHSRCSGEDPVSSMAAAATAAADGVRAAVPRIAERLGVQVPDLGHWCPDPGREVRLDLRPLLPGGPVDLGTVDLVSGGAISNASLFTLLRLPGVRADIRVIEPDTLATSNLNRYALGRRSQVNQPKTAVLETFTTDDISIHGVGCRLDNDTASRLGPLSTKVLVGVDHIPSRWTSQRMASGLVVVGATSHDYVVVSAHPEGGPCAGCTHPKDDDTDGEIPTISFVSFWAGMLQALNLVRYSVGPATPPGRTEMYPLNLDKPRGLAPFGQAPSPNCPVACTASAEVRARRNSAGR